MSAINYKIEGEGSPVVLIHGFCENLEMWQHTSLVLSEQYQIISIDLPGFGKSPLPNFEVNLEQIAAIITDWLKARGIEKAVFLGHSLGGYVSLAIAEHFPELIRGFGLIHSTAYADTEEGKLNRNRVVEFILKHGHDKWIETFAPSLFAKENLSHCESDVALIREMGLNTSQESIIAYTYAMRDRKDRFEVWQNLESHALFIGGTEDIRIGPQISEEHIYAREKVDGYILNRIGHMGMFEDKAHFNEILKVYLKKVC